MVRYQQLSGDQIPDFVQLSALVNGLKSDVSHYVRLYLASDSSFIDLDILLNKYFNNTFVQTEASLNAVWDKAWRDKQQGGKENGGKSKPRGKGAAYPPQPQAHEGEWEQEQLPKRQRWCDICWKQGHTTHACWYNPDQQQQQQHQTEGAQLPKKKQWCNLCWKKGHSTQAWWWNDNQQRQQQHLQHQAWYHLSMQQQPAQTYNIDQHAAYTDLVPDNQPVLSLEPQSQASTQVANQDTMCTIVQQESLSRASCLPEPWCIQVDTGAANSKRQSSQNLWPEACPSSEPRFELASQLCHCRCCRTFAWLRQHP